MKNKFLIAALLITGLGLAIALADIPNYKTLTATGTTAATFIVPADPSLATRVVSFNCTSDKAGSVLALKAGAGAYVVSANTTNTTTLTVARTNGLAANDYLVISKADGTTNVYCQISSFPQSTNITLGAVSGITVEVGDSVYKMSAATSIPIGAANVVGNGEAIYTAPRGRPIYATLDGTSACTINSFVVRQE